MASNIVGTMHSVFFPETISENSGPWQPSVDVYRARNGWLLKADLAGVEPEDLVLHLQGNRLQISGIRRDCSLEEGCHFYRLEINYSRFERTIDLPDDLETARVSTEFRNGMLLIRITTRTER